MIKNILVTGGCGFIGSSLIRKLVQSGKYKVCNLDKLTYAGNIASISEIINDSNHSFHRVDICNFEEVKTIFFEFKPDIVMHLAAESHVDRSISDPSEFIQTNVIGTYNMLELSKEYFKNILSSSNKQFLFHHISTDEVFGDLGNTTDLFNENTPYSPSSPYSASKAASDHFVRAWGRTFKLPFIITNCSNNYGPYQFPEKLIPRIILNALQGKNLPIYGDGSQIRDWLYVDDHVNALIKVATNGKIGETYNIGGNNEKTNLEVVKCICNILDKKIIDKPNQIESFRELITFVEDRPGHDIRYAIDASKIFNEIGWTPSETFETGLNKTVEWYLDNTSWSENILSKEYIKDNNNY